MDSTRHKCFVSYHAADRDEVEAFLDEFGTEFIAKTVGVTDEDDFIDSDDTGYIMDHSDEIPRGLECDDRPCRLMHVGAAIRRLGGIFVAA